MIILNLYKDNVVDNDNSLYPIYHLEIFDKMNIILGDSRTGKTYMFDRLSAAINREDPWTYECYNAMDTKEVICNSEFILSKCPTIKDLVINYKKYITPEFKNTGKYFSSLLFRYVKAKPPVESKMNATKFYRKGAPYFQVCFIEDCCSYQKFL